MRYWSGLTFGMQALIIALLSVGATYGFSSSFVFPPLVSVAYPLRPLQLSIIMAGILMLAGALLIIVKKEPSNGAFVSLVALVCVPSVLAHSATDWAQIVGAGTEMETGLNVEGTLLLTMLVAIGYLLLRFTARFNQSALAMADRGYARDEVGAVYGSQHTWGAGIAGGAAALGLLVFLLANLIERGFGGSSEELSAVILPVGILSSLALVAVAYGVAIRGRSPVRPAERRLKEGDREKQGTLAGQAGHSAATSRPEDERGPQEKSGYPDKVTEHRYVGDALTGIYHTLECGSVRLVEKKDTVWFPARSEAENAGYGACEVCKEKPRAQPAKTGTEQRSDEDEGEAEESERSRGAFRIVGNALTGVYHLYSCRSVRSAIVEKKHAVWFHTKGAAEAAGYRACQVCRGEHERFPIPSENRDHGPQPWSPYPS